MSAVKRNPYLNFVFVTTFLAVSATVAQSDLTPYAYVQEINLPEVDSDQLVSVILEDAVYEASKLDYADVRVINNEGEDLPRIIRPLLKMGETMVEKRHVAKIVNLEKKEDNRVELVVGIPSRVGAVSGLVIHTPLRNYERSIAIYGRRKADAEWLPLSSESMLYDYSRFADVQCNTIYFKEGKYEALKIEIQAVTDLQASRLMKLKETFADSEQKERTETKTLESRPFRIDSVEVVTRSLEQRVKSHVFASYAVKSARFEVDAGGSNRVVIDTFRQPLTSVRIKTDSINFSRSVILEAGETTNKQSVVQDKIHDLTYGDLLEHNLELKFPETRTETLYLEARNGNGPPLNITGIDLTGHVYELVFLARPSEAYRLYYGYSTAGIPTFDTATIDQLLEKGFKPADADLSAREENPDHRVSGIPLLNSKMFFLIVVTLVVGGLGLLLYNALKRTN